jgi:hypothetical protein
MVDRAHSPRRDALPEYSDYPDTGCQYWSACLSCPFERCRFDADRVEAERLWNMQQALELRAQGLTVRTVAAKLELSERTVMRLLADSKKELTHA